MERQNIIKKRQPVPHHYLTLLEGTTENVRGLGAKPSPERGLMSLKDKKYQLEYSQNILYQRRDGILFFFPFPFILISSHESALY